MLENIFHLKENHTDVKTEIMAGITTFMTMAYILAVNPNILSASGMDSEAVLIATALASFVGTALMALLANYPFALAPGMGLNAYFSYTVVLTMGYSWQLALMAVFVEGIIFIVLSLTNVREGIFNAIPMTLKSAVSVGIGLFVAFVGLQNAKLIVNSDSTLVTYQHFKGETFSSVGVGAILALIGVVITAVLLVKKVKGGILGAGHPLRDRRYLCAQRRCRHVLRYPHRFCQLRLLRAGQDLRSGIQDRFLRRWHPELLRRHVLLPVR